MVFRSAVAIQAPGHALRLMLVNNLHFVDRAVAAIATDATIHVSGVIEISIIGNLVDAHPVDRLASFPAFADGFQFRAVSLDLRVAGHARLGAWDVRVRSDFNEAVAVAAIEPELLNVDDVREWNRLSRFVTDTGVFGGKIIRQSAGDRCYNRANADHQLQRKPVCPFWKKVCHVVRASPLTI